MHYGFRFVLAALAIWRITHLFVNEDGPWDASLRLRRALNGTFAGNLFSCFYCLSIWIAAPFAFFCAATRVERIVCWWALSGAAILLERATGERLDIRVGDKYGDE
jgi:hypothetical protein